MNRAKALLAIMMIYAIAFSVPFARAEGGYTLRMSPSGAITLSPGQTKKLTLSVSPVNLIEHTVTWTSENPYIASVSAGGTVMALAAGDTLVTATIETGASLSARVKVSGNAVTSLVIVDADIELALGASAQMTCSINENADDKRVLWSSDDASVATVDGGGVVTATGYGTAVITARAVNGMTASASVYVPSDVQSIMLDPAEALVAPGGALEIDAYVFPGNARNRALTWVTSDQAIASVDQNGVITGEQRGQCIVRAMAQNGVYALVNVTVDVIPESIRLDKSEILLTKESREGILTCIASPASAGGCAISWESSDETVVRVRDGALSATGYGSATVTARTLNGLTAQCAVYVGVKAQSMAFSQESYSVAAGGAPMKLSLVFTPAQSYEADITWRIEDESIARVDESGNLTPLAVGETLASATGAGGLSAQCKIIVYDDTRSLRFEQDAYTLPAHTKAALSVTATPVDIAEPPTIWESSDPSVCAVANGVAYAQKPGVVTVRALSADRTLSCECEVTVSENPGAVAKTIALTFDNGPSENTPLALDALSRFGAKATFFMMGANVQARPDIAALLSETAHEIGNHTYQNISLNTSSLADIATSIERTDALIQAAVGREATVLRAPDASLPVWLFNTFLDTRRFVGWSADMGDTRRGATAEDVRDKALSEAFDHAILVFHDSSAATAEALAEILPALIVQGYEFVTVSELMEITGDTSAVFTVKK